jgi:hypothetical protein
MSCLKIAGSAAGSPPVHRRKNAGSGRPPIYYVNTDFEAPVRESVKRTQPRAGPDGRALGSEATTLGIAARIVAGDERQAGPQQVAVLAAQALLALARANPRTQRPHDHAPQQPTARNWPAGHEAQRDPTGRATHQPDQENDR